MKLTHRDFRPLRRSKYVAQPLKRRPTLRILALAALGIAVYLKYDSVVHSEMFQNLRHPGRLMDALFQREAPIAAVPAQGLAWSADSARLDAECVDAAVAACLSRWEGGVGSETIGALRGVLAKASMQWGADPAHGIKARFIRIQESSLDGQSHSLELARLEIRGDGKPLVLERPSGNASAPFCERQRCLDANPPKMPLARYRIEGKNDAAGPDRASSATLSLVPLGDSEVTPILRGRVVEVPAEMGPGQWVKIYHGANVFSFYRGLSSLAPAVATGAMIEPGETLGQVAATGDSAGILDVRIEKGGVLIDPLGFLGIVPDAVAASGPETHGR